MRAWSYRPTTRTRFARRSGARRGAPRPRARLARGAPDGLAASPRASRPHLQALARRGALRAAAEDRLMPSRRLTDFLLYAAVFTMSFEKLFWNVAGKIALTEVISILFIGAY